MPGPWDKCIEANIAEFDKLPLFRKEVKRLEKMWGTDKIGLGPVGRSRDSTLMEKSNFDAIWKDLSEKFPDQVEIENLGHWAVGWVEGIVWPAYDKNGEPTDVAIAVCDWEDQLKEYPVADDEVYSAAEYEASLENIEMIISPKVPKTTQTKLKNAAVKVYSWLANNDPGSWLESVDDQGAWPPEEAIAEALKATRYVK